MGASWTRVYGTLKYIEVKIRQAQNFLVYFEKCKNFFDTSKLINVI